MPAFVIAIPEELSPEPMVTYRENVEGAMAVYGGRYRALIRHQVETLEGDWLPPLGVVVLEFPSYEQAKAWYHSPEYAPLRRIRMTGDRWNIIVVDGLGEGETHYSIGILTADEQARMQQKTNEP